MQRRTELGRRRRIGFAVGTVVSVLVALAAIAWPALRSLPEPLRGTREEASTDSLEPVPFSAAQSRSVSLAEVAARLDACAAGEADPRCSGVIYFWTAEMPLSSQGIDEIASAAAELGLELDVVRSAELYPDPGTASEEVEAIAGRLVAAGASLHAPALVVHRGGKLDRSAILGYKTADAYVSLVAERLRGDFSSSATPTAFAAAPAAETGAVSGGADAVPPRAAGFTGDVSWRDFTAQGQPGAYFRWVPGRNTLAYEAGGRIYLLDLESGESGSAPGFVDFVPTPDGRLFVTPGRGALEFYDADEVFEASRMGRGRSVQPVYSDSEMRDQYPSVGILSTSTEAGTARTVYRVLTSWFDKVVFRDYDVSSGPNGTRVRPLGDPVVACASYRFSIPIMAQSGREVAGRDEASATTKIFRLADDGGCTEVADLRLPTGKVAWHADGQRLAFAIPQGAVSDGSGLLFRGRGGTEEAGIFLFDRSEGSAVRVEGSLDARRLAFPEFVGADQIVFLLPPEAADGRGRFRLVCCLR
jgi:hypothetical protein